MKSRAPDSSRFATTEIGKVIVRLRMGYREVDAELVDYDTHCMSSPRSPNRRRGIVVAADRDGLGVRADPVPARFAV